MNRDLQELGRPFAGSVEKMTEGVHVAVGCGISHAVMIEGERGLIIVDTMTPLELVQEVLAPFGKISPRPITAIVTTHTLPESVPRTQDFAAEGTPEPYAHEALLPAFPVPGALRTACHEAPLRALRTRPRQGGEGGPRPLGGSRKTRQRPSRPR